MKKLLLLIFLPFCAIAGEMDIPKEPIEITADTLEIHQMENVAIFNGDVKVRQSKFTLNSDTMRVYYKPAENGEFDDENSNVQGQISRIEAEGNVILTADKDKITGEKAVYKADTQIANISGNVVLTKGANTIRGSYLEYNLATNESKITAPKNQRVHGFFVPEK